MAAPPPNPNTQKSLTSFFTNHSRPTPSTQSNIFQNNNRGHNLIGGNGAPQTNQSELHSGFSFSGLSQPTESIVFKNHTQNHFQAMMQQNISANQSKFDNRPTRSSLTSAQPSLFDNRSSLENNSLGGTLPIPKINPYFTKTTLGNEPQVYHMNLNPFKQPGNLDSQSQSGREKPGLFETKKSSVAEVFDVKSSPKDIANVNNTNKKGSKKITSQALKNSNSFSYEMNKMLFISRVTDLLAKHQMNVPEDLLDGTDFIPALLEFLEKFDIHLPSQEIPKFRSNKIQGTNEIQFIKKEKQEIPIQIGQNLKRTFPLQGINQNGNEEKSSEDYLDLSDASSENSS